jgi:Competence protein CoiA-like family
MKFAVVERELREAAPDLSAECQACGAAMIARCGRVRVWHWAHRGARICDSWWEPETEWHRAWKNHFPKSWQEIIHPSESGEKHIADVKTESGVVLEFQHSSLCPEERESRESFYQNMVWVVDGLRRKQDRVKFFASLRAPIGVIRSTLGTVNRVSRYASIRPLCGDLTPVARTAERIYRRCQRGSSCASTVKNDLSRGSAPRPLTVLQRPLSVLRLIV